MLKALLFDMDGTLVESDHLHLHVWADVLAPHGFTVDDAFYRARIMGKLNETIVSGLFPEKSREECLRFGDDKEAEFRRRFPVLDPIDGLMDVVGAAHGAGLRLAVVTNAPRANAVHVADAIGLAPYLTTSVASEDVARGKPAPDPYLLALERLGLAPHEALVFEDSATGIAAARAAGIEVVGLATTLAEAELLSLGARLAIRTYRDPRLGAVLAA